MRTATRKKSAKKTSIDSPNSAATPTPTPPSTKPPKKALTPKSADSKVEEPSGSIDDVEVAPELKVTPVAATRAGRKGSKSSSAGKAAKAPKSVEVVVVKMEENVEEASSVGDVVGEVVIKGESIVESEVEEETIREENVVGSVGEEPKKEEEKEEESGVVNAVEVSVKKEVIETEEMVVKKVEEDNVEEDNVKEVGDGENASEIESGLVNVENSSIDDANVEEEAAKGIVEEKGGEPPAEEKKDDAESVEYDGGEGERFQEPGDDECAEDDMSEPEEEIGRLEDEQMELSAHAKERKIKKEQEVFVGGLDRDAVEDDIKKAFEKIGEVIDIRLHKNPVTNKNKGYAFVRFASKEQASRALAELKTPIIRGKRCGLAPSEDNDTLFIGNICNTWTKEAIKQKLKEYGLDGVENVTLVPDAQHDGLSRGFAFVEFSCHNDAMLAYKRLQKPDAIFGHAERSAKVAFAEPLREPDPEVMAQVKSVFVDGLPPQWDEECVREYFKQYGEIERIVLARNMPSAKRKDFGFVDYNTHDAAVACINGLNNTELGDERSKTRVRVRLSNPLPKTQAVKGGLCGGFRVGRGGSGTGFPRFGRGFGRGGYANRGSFPRGTDFHGRGRGRTGRFAFAGDSYQEGSYSGFHGRQPFGGRGLRMGYDEEMVHPNFGRSRHVVERGRGRSFQPRRPQFQYESHYSQPVGGRYLADDPYLYDDVGHGMKRPYSMMDHEQPGYLEPNRLRPRFDHPDPAFPPRETHYQDSYGAGGSGYSHDYYSSSYGGSSFSSTYGPDRPYGSGGYYY